MPSDKPQRKRSIVYFSDAKISRSGKTIQSQGWGQYEKQSLPDILKRFYGKEVMFHIEEILPEPNSGLDSE